MSLAAFEPFNMPKTTSDALVSSSQANASTSPGALLGTCSAMAHTSFRRLKILASLRGLKILGAFGPRTARPSCAPSWTSLASTSQKSGIHLCRKNAFEKLDLRQAAEAACKTTPRPTPLFGSDQHRPDGPDFMYSEGLYNRPALLSCDAEGLASQP
ncbi:unnamed protein product, partial [Prorocentrum cordatum]